jgi:hypothetical protein
MRISLRSSMRRGRFQDSFMSESRPGDARVAGPSIPRTMPSGRSAGREVHEVGGQLSVDAPCLPQLAPEWKSVWWDVFAIPSARDVGGVVIPGYYEMRSRFVDYPGVYVTHCHILIHEDRGMMYRVEVPRAKPARAPHR